MGRKERWDRKREEVSKERKEGGNIRRKEDRTERSGREEEKEG